MKELEMGVLRNIKQSRRWGWYDKDITALLRENFSGQRLTTALAIYLSLTELASNQGFDEFPAYYSQIAKFSGKSISTAKFYCSEFIKLGILAKENRKIDNKTNLSNQWSLLTPSVSNKYQTSNNDDYYTSDKNGYQLLEENELEKNNQNAVKDVLKTKSYKDLEKVIARLRRNEGGRTWQG